MLFFKEDRNFAWIMVRKFRLLIPKTSEIRNNNTNAPAPFFQPATPPVAITPRTIFLIPATKSWKQLPVRDHQPWKSLKWATYFLVVIIASLQRFLTIYKGVAGLLPQLGEQRLIVREMVVGCMKNAHSSSYMQHGEAEMPSNIVKTNSLANVWVEKWKVDGSISSLDSSRFARYSH